MKKNILAMSAAALFVAGSANASLVMYLDDLSTVGIDVIVVDNFDGGVGTMTALGVSTHADLLNIDGGINFTGAVGNFSVNVSTGTSYPLINGPDLLDLNSVQVSGAAGTIVVGLTDTDYFIDTDLRFSIGGVSNANLTAKAWADAGNGEFAETTLLADLGPFTSGAFSAGSVATPFLGNTPYSLTIETTLTHTGAGQITSYNSVVSVPEPSILALFGLGLAGIGFAGRRRQAK